MKDGTWKPLSSEERLKQDAAWLNEKKGNLQGYDCPLCKNRGNSFEVRNGALVSVECQCMAARRSIWRIERSGLKNLLDEYTFESFETGEPWQAEMKRKALDFLKSEGGAWFAAMGSVGAGKTHICTAICGKLLSEGKAVRYMLWRDESVRLKATVNDASEYAALINPLKTAPVLYIDDLFKTKRGAEIGQGDINLAFELLNFRCSNKKLVTIISSEYTIEEIINIDKGIGSRIYQRSKGFYLKLSGDKNRRLT